MVDVTDDFNRAGPTLGSNWTTLTSTSAINITGSDDAIGTANDADSGAYWSANTFEDDQFSQATIAVADDDGCGCLVRVQTGAETMYMLYTNDTVCQYYETTAGSFAQLGADVATNTVLGNVFKLRIAGDTLTGSVAGADLATRTDATITSGRPGILIFDNITGFDDWSGGPIITEAASPLAFSVHQGGGRMTIIPIGY